MTNLEKYYHKVINKNLDDGDISCIIHKIRTGIDHCDEYGVCKVCRHDSFKWLGEEYKEPEPETDWSKVPRGTKVFVWGYNEKMKEVRKFFDYDPSFICPFITYNLNENGINTWRHCELAEDEK